MTDPDPPRRAAACPRRADVWHRASADCRRPDSPLPRGLRRPGHQAIYAMLTGPAPAARSGCSPGSATGWPGCVRHAGSQTPAPTWPACPAVPGPGQPAGLRRHGRRGQRAAPQAPPPAARRQPGRPADLAATGQPARQRTPSPQATRPPPAQRDGGPGNPPRHRVAGPGTASPHVTPPTGSPRRRVPDAGRHVRAATAGERLRSPARCRAGRPADRWNQLPGDASARPQASRPVRPMRRGRPAGAGARRPDAPPRRSGRDVTCWLPAEAFSAGPGTASLYQLISQRLDDGRPVDPLIVAWDASPATRAAPRKAR